MAPLQINVVGTGSTIRPAERAILVLQAYSPDLSTAAEASAIVTLTANTIREAITPHCAQDTATGKTLPGAAIAHYSMSTLDTNSRSRAIDSKKEKYEIVYTAKAQFNIKFSDFTVLGQLATDFSAMQNVSIQRIEWKLTDVTDASIQGEARKRAAADAIQRARDYAQVFGGVAEEDLEKRVKAVDVKENGYYQRGTKPQLHIGKRQRFEGESSFGKEELQFQPEDVRLSVNVDGRFVVVD